MAVKSLMNSFAVWMTRKLFADVKAHIDIWVNSLDFNGKPNSPNTDTASFNIVIKAIYWDHEADAAQKLIERIH